MRTQDNGGPAFPVPGLMADEDFNGMTLRDYFAAKAMQGAFSSPIAASRDEQEYIAMHAYRMADAMLKARALAAPTTGE